MTVVLVKLFMLSTSKLVADGSVPKTLAVLPWNSVALSRVYKSKLTRRFKIVSSIIRSLATTCR